MNDIQFTREARKDLERLRSHEDQALRALGELRENAHAGKALQGSLRGLWSLRFGSYRIIYTIDGPTVILVILVGHERTSTKKLNDDTRLSDRRKRVVVRTAKPIE